MKTTRKEKTKTALIALALIASATVQQSAAHASQSVYRAMKQIEGLHERKHRRKLQRVIGVDPVRVQWCGAAIAYAVRKAGKKPPKFAVSMPAWLRWGQSIRLRNAKRGDIVIVRSRASRSGLHGGVFSKRAKGRVCLISGNSKNTTRESCYKAGSVRAVRR